MMGYAVVGAGFAGLAAVDALLERGRTTELFSVGVGASALGSGACDFTPWYQLAARGTPRAGALDDRGTQLLQRLGYTLGATSVATTAGLVRPAHGCHQLVLNLERAAGRIVGVLDVGRADWHAVRLASELAREAWSQRTHTRFVPIELHGMFDSAERALPLAAFSRLLDIPERAAAWGRAMAQLEMTQTTLGALLCGPWLGTEPNELLPFSPGKLLIGETLSPPEGTIGERFVRSRAALLGAWGVALRAERVLRLEARPRAVLLCAQDEHGVESSQEYEAVVVATGGLLGGGLSFESADASGGSGPARGALLSTLDPRPRVPPGSWDGADLTRGSGAWLRIGSADGVPRADPPERIEFAGDVCKGSAAEPNGCVGSALISGRAAVERVLDLPTG